MKRNIKFIRPYIFILIMLLVASGNVAAEKEEGIDVLAHYELGEGSIITYQSAPPSLSDRSGKGFDLQRVGNPVAFADAPLREGAPQTAVLFNAVGQRYEGDKAVGQVGDGLIMEAWVKLRSERAVEGYGSFRGIVANGDGHGGWVLGQKDDRWVLLVGGVGFFDIGKVIPDQWVHLAAVLDGENGSLFLNGERVGSFQPGKAFRNSFTIGTSGNDSESFTGLVHAVRLGRLLPDFDFARDTLIAGSQIAELSRKRVESQHRLYRKRVAEIVRPQAGVRLVDRIESPFVGKDWLVEAVDQKVELQIEQDEEREMLLLQMDNGLASRTFLFRDNLGCVSMRHLGRNSEFIRAVKPEARVKLDGRWYDIGGLVGQPEQSYLLDEWYPEMQGPPDAFQFTGLTVSEPEARYPWQPKFNAVAADWPPKGLRVSMRYAAPENIVEQHRGVAVTVHYEMYVGLPLVAKWFTLENATGESVVVEQVESEILAVAQDQIDRLHVESDYSFAMANAHVQGSALMHLQNFPDWAAPGGTTLWETDPNYNSWASHNQAEDLFLDFPHQALMKSRIPLGPDAEIAPGDHFRSMVTFELLHDSDDRVRKTLAHRRLYRVLAPQVTESLLAAGITSQDEVQIKGFIDQMYELGFERLDIMAWPGINHVNLDPDYIAKWKRIADYAGERGIIMGGYELWIASRGRGAEVDCIDPATGQPGSFFGNSVCVASEWYDSYTERMWRFFDETGFKATNFDGPYHGDVCASKNHKYHRGLEDSQWRQWQKQVEIIHEFQRRNYYALLPDWYFLNGQTATGMGYRENTANLSPQQQLLLGRQYIYDGTWHKIPTMGWMTLQLVGFYSRDARLGLEPLIDNIDRYERGLVQHLGSGCQLTVRGDRLYDTPEVKAMVGKWTRWFHKYRGILTSDIIHLGRPTGRDLDAMMHVNSELDERALVLVFNPTERRIQRELHLPLYYTGLVDTAAVREQEGESVRYELDREYSIRVPVNVAAGDFTWLVVEAD